MVAETNFHTVGALHGISDAGDIGTDEHEKYVA